MTENAAPRARRDATGQAWSRIGHRFRGQSDRGRRRPAQRLPGFLVVAAFAGAVMAACSATSSFDAGREPALVIDKSVGSDLQALALATWGQFLAAFASRTECLESVQLQATQTLNGRAAYDPDTATVTVRVPGTPAMLRSALIHEWAHHVEFGCPALEGLKPEFLRALGLPPDTPWRPDDIPANTPTGEWAAIPSEQYAEAAVELVLGDRPIPTLVRVRPEALRVLARWARGE